MCEFQRIPPSRVVDGETVAKSLPICEYTKSLCTYCICGNSNTYNEAIKRSDNNAE
ncbi:MAG: hypothetical protein IJZ16_04670 [Clostridia bacterium]|nr:hypothetical protein [Clostridia bacterium]